MSIGRASPARLSSGVRRVGSSVLADLTFERHGDVDREFFPSNTFAGMTEPNVVDGAE
jgi:hypothetical protein